VRFVRGRKTKLCSACQTIAVACLLRDDFGSCEPWCCYKHPLLSVLGVRTCAFDNPTCLAARGSRPFTGTVRTVCEFLRRKEVIQPQVPLRLPCYDFIPVTSYTLGLYPLAVGTSTSGATGFHDVTGGVYKTRERIHGAVDDAPLLAIPTSWRRVAASNPN
jgi:hypothetical protein